MAVIPPAYRTIPKRGSRFSRKIMQPLVEPSASQHYFTAPKQCKSHWASFPCLIEIVMFLPPSLENCEICPLNWLVSYALKHVIFANGH
jgi:hypothetical protein